MSVTYFDIVSIEDTGSEPVILGQAQTYLRNEDSGGREDSLIESLITASRQLIEEMTNRSLVAKDITIECKDWKGNLPFGPIDGDITFDSGEGIRYGSVYPNIEVENEAVISYSTKAYEKADLNFAILELVMFYYERGEFGTRLTSMSVPPKIKKVILRHTRRTFLG